MRKKAVKPLPRPKIIKGDISLADYLSGQSTLGGTTLEKLVDGAAKQLGIRFDAAQYYVPLISLGTYTLVDRVIMGSRTLVYIDGPQHTLRVGTEQKDMLQTMALRALGWKVVRLSYTDLLVDPVGTTAQVLWGR